MSLLSNLQSASIIQQYPLPDTMGIAKDIFKKLTLLTNEIPPEMLEDYFLPLLPAVVKLCQTFPPVCSDATAFLVQLSKVCIPSNRPTAVFSYPSDPGTRPLQGSSWFEHRCMYYIIYGSNLLKHTWMKSPVDFLSPFRTHFRNSLVVQL